MTQALIEEATFLAAELDEAQLLRDADRTATVRSGPRTSFTPEQQQQIDAFRGWRD